MQVLVESAVISPVCPECGSLRAWRAGFYHAPNGEVSQRYLCRDCAHRFTIPSNLKSLSDVDGTHQISACDDVKNLVSTSILKLDVGDITKIENHLEYLKKEGYKPATMERRKSALVGLLKLGANLGDPESVKTVIANQDRWKASQKQVVVFAYDLYVKQYNLSWERPWYEAVRELPFIPQEREIDDLIAGVHKEIGEFSPIGRLRCLWQPCKQG